MGGNQCNDTWTCCSPLSTRFEYKKLLNEHLHEVHTHYLRAVHFIALKFYNFFYFFVAPSALRTKLSSTTLRVANDETPETVSPTSSTEKPISHSATGKYK